MSITEDYKVALNFWALRSHDFQFRVYRRKRNTQQEERPDGCTLFSLPEDSLSGDTHEERSYDKFWVSFEPSDGFLEFICEPGDNLYLTTHFLLHALTQKSLEELHERDFEVMRGFRRRVEYTLRRHDGEDCEERVWLEPHLLRATGEFGFLVDFRVKRYVEGPPSRRVQQISLSLDEQFSENHDFYVDRYEKVEEFANEYFHKLFPITLESDGGLIQVHRGLKQLPAPQLDTKTYVFGEEKTDSSQFMGVKKNGPLQKALDDVLLFFVYKPDHKPFSYDLFRALRGDTFATFPGMAEMFGYTLGEEHVRGTAIEEFTEKGIDDAIHTISREAGDRAVVPIIIIPWDKDEATEMEDHKYYLMKHRFLQSGLPTQFVSLSTLTDSRTLKWSASNIALAVFSKMGGVPWKVSPQHSNCLIIGIGQSHKRLDNEIHRYFAYTVLTDSSGIYENLQVLGDSNKQDQYLSQFRENLLEVLREYSGRFDRFAVHATFSLRREELNAIKNVLDVYYDESQEVDLVALKFNDRNKYFGYAPSSNSMVPYESTYLTLSKRDYLVWFEGLQYHRSSVKSRIGGPMYIRFFYNTNDLSNEAKRDYLQDALNISGANWRGFNAKSKPISVYYASRIAQYYRAFDEYNFEDVDLSNMTPWFL